MATQLEFSVKVKPKKVHMRILSVLYYAGKPLTDFEFSEIRMGDISGRQHVGCTESTIGRRMREMAEMGLLRKNIRADKNYMEYSPA